MHFIILNVELNDVEQTPSNSDVVKPRLSTTLEGICDLMDELDFHW